MKDVRQGAKRPAYSSRVTLCSVLKCATRRRPISYRVKTELTDSTLFPSMLWLQVFSRQAPKCRNGHTFVTNGMEAPGATATEAASGIKTTASGGSRIAEKRVARKATDNGRTFLTNGMKAAGAAARVAASGIRSTASGGSRIAEGRQGKRDARGVVMAAEGDDRTAATRCRLRLRQAQSQR